MLRILNFEKFFSLLDFIGFIVMCFCHVSLLELEFKKNTLKHCEAARTFRYNCEFSIFDSFFAENFDCFAALSLI